MVLDIATYELVVLIGTLTGIGVRTGFYYYSKRREDEAAGLVPRDFGKEFGLTALIAAVITITGGFLSFEVVKAAVPNTGSLVTVLAGSFTAAIGLNEIFNRLLSLIGTTPILVERVEEEEPEPEEA